MVLCRVISSYKSMLRSTSTRIVWNLWIHVQVKLFTTVFATNSVDIDSYAPH